MNVEHHVLAALAGPIVSTKHMGGHKTFCDHVWVVVLHEAAHGAVATSLGFRLAEVSILPGDGTLGHCRYGGDPPRGAVPRSDTSKAPRMTWLSQGCEYWRETRRYLRRLRQRTHDLVRAEIYSIHRLADVLRIRRVPLQERARTVQPLGSTSWVPQAPISSR